MTKRPAAEQVVFDQADREPEALASAVLAFAQCPNPLLYDQQALDGDVRTYLALRSYAWQDASCWPGQDGLAARLGKSRRQVIRHLQNLRRLGYIEWRRRGVGQTNLYVLLHVPVMSHQGSEAAPAVCHSRHINGDVSGTSSVTDTSQEIDSREEDSRQEDSRKTSQAALFPPEALSLAERLRTRILANKPDAKVAPAARWARTMRLMLERDGRRADRIAAVIDWCQAHRFWRSNILSADKLREKFDQLELQMQGGDSRSSARPPTHPDDRPADGDKFAPLRARQAEQEQDHGHTER